MNIQAHIRLWAAAHVQLLDVRLLHMGVDERHHNWRFPASVLGFVLEGNGTVDLDGTAWALQPYLLFHGGKGTAMTLRSSGVMRCYLLIYKGELMNGLRPERLKQLEQERPFSIIYAMQTDDSLLLKVEHSRHLP